MSLFDVTLQALLQWPLNDNFQGGKLNGRFFKTSLCRIPACARYYYFKKMTAVFVSCCSYFSETQTPFYAEKIPDSLELKATILNLPNFELTAREKGKIGRIEMRALRSTFLNALCCKQSSEDLIAFEWKLGSKVTIFDEKSRPRGEAPFSLGYCGELGTEASPLSGDPSCLWNSTIRTGRTQKRNPLRRGNVFPQKQFPPICISATNLFPVSDATIQKWPVAFWL